MFDQASFALMATLSVDQAYRGKHQGTVVTVQCDIVYKREAHAGHILSAPPRVAELRDKVIRLALRLVEEGSSGLAALADVAGVYMDIEVRKSGPFPENIRARAAAMLGEHAADG